MPDGRVWHAGSSVDTASGTENQDTRIEIYEPWYLGHPERPRLLEVVTDGPAGSMHLRDGNTYVLTESEDPANLEFVILRPGTVTHAWNMGQRYVGLQSDSVRTFAGEGGSTRAWHRVFGPLNSNMAPPGDYLLFALNSAAGTGLGVPSEGMFVHVDRTVTSSLHLSAGDFTRSFTTLAEPPTGDGSFEFSNGWTFEYTGIDLGPHPGGFAELVVNSAAGPQVNVQFTLDENGGPRLVEAFNIPGNDQSLSAPDSNLKKCNSAEPSCLDGVRNLRVRVSQPCDAGAMCGGGAEPSRTIHSFELRPDGTFDPDRTALFATGPLYVNAFASVRDPATGGNPNIVGGAVRLHPDTHVGNVAAVGRFEAFWRTQVHGWVRTGFDESTRVDSDVLIEGGIQRGRAVAIPDLSGWRTFSSWYGFQAQEDPSYSESTITSGDWIELEPGHYGALTLNSQATALLKEGTYYFVDFIINSDANLELPLEGGVTVHVLQGLTLRGNIIDNPAWSQDNPGQHGNLRIISYGSSEVHIGNKPFIGTVVAPNAKITINTANPQGQGAPPRFPDQPGHHGAFYAREIELHQGTPVWHYPYRPWLDPS